jgi:hypothetical protein
VVGGGVCPWQAVLRPNAEAMLPLDSTTISAFKKKSIQETKILE